ncbi:hypothetical protein AB1Y20_013675 [Prymnesium parvum]|uniref:Uncharacterized protein n=1 Tax=Prymnesium parvum TaxID=97485 RepID=A0AB34IG75_PRYPA
MPERSSPQPPALPSLHSPASPRPAPPPASPPASPPAPPSPPSPSPPRSPSAALAAPRSAPSPPANPSAPMASPTEPPSLLRVEQSSKPPDASPPPPPDPDDDGQHGVRVGLLSAGAPPPVPRVNLGKASSRGGARSPRATPAADGGLSRAGSAASPRLLVRRASSVLASPHILIKNASSTLVQIHEGTREVMTALRPGIDLALGIDVLGLPPPPPDGAPPPGPPSSPMKRASRRSSQVSIEEEREVQITDEDAEELLAGGGLTSAVLREGVDEAGLPLLDWAEELLLLSHEPLRRDMLEMQRAMQVHNFGDLPESWRVRAFFRFFGCWCLLVSQQHAVEVAVHYDWLLARGELASETRSATLAYHRKVELEMHSISRLEMKILDEISSIDPLAEPWSRAAQELRSRMDKLTADVRAHLSEQERLLPPLLRAHWGRVSPPQLVTRSLKAAKGALAKGSKSKGAERPLWLMWVLHYLRRRNFHRARYLQGQLPTSTRLAIALRYQKHSHFLNYLRFIVHHEQPGASIVDVAPHTKEALDGQRANGGPVSENERQRRAGMVNAMLAAANAERVDVPASGSGPTRKLAESTPAHTYENDTSWMKKAQRIPSNLFKKIGIDKEPSTPRRI